MSQSEPELDPIPQEWLAAYADGELGHADALRVERWIASHPEARELLRVQEAFAGPAFRELVQIPVPEDDAFDRVRDRIAAAVVHVRPPRRFPWAIAFLGLATAAGLLIALNLRPAVPGVPGPRAVVEVTPEPPYEVASDDDVEIVSMFDRDAPMLIVGRHPIALRAPAWASGSDVVLEWAEPDAQGYFSDMAGAAGTRSVPMVLMPPAKGR